MTDGGIWILNLWLPNRKNAHINTLFKALTVLQYARALKSTRHGQNQAKEKNSDYWIEYFPFEKLFGRKLIILKTRAEHFFEGIVLPFMYFVGFLLNLFVDLTFPTPISKFSSLIVLYSDFHRFLHILSKNLSSKFFRWFHWYIIMSRRFFFQKVLASFFSFFLSCIVKYIASIFQVQTSLRVEIYVPFLYATKKPPLVGCCWMFPYLYQMTHLLETLLLNSWGEELM